jgi:hypothetical protein
MQTIVFMLVIVSLAAPAGTQAEEPTDPNLFQERAVLEAGKEVQGDYVAFGRHVQISGTVNGWRGGDRHHAWVERCKIIDSSSLSMMVNHD